MRRHVPESRCVAGLQIGEPQGVGYNREALEFFAGEQRISYPHPGN